MIRTSSLSEPTWKIGLSQFFSRLFVLLSLSFVDPHHIDIPFWLPTAFFGDFPQNLPCTLSYSITFHLLLDLRSSHPQKVSMPYWHAATTSMVTTILRKSQFSLGFCAAFWLLRASLRIQHISLRISLHYNCYGPYPNNPFFFTFLVSSFSLASGRDYHLYIAARVLHPPSDQIICPEVLHHFLL